VTVFAIQAFFGIIEGAAKNCPCFAKKRLAQSRNRFPVAFLSAAFSVKVARGKSRQVKVEVSHKEGFFSIFHSID